MKKNIVEGYCHDVRNIFSSLIIRLRSEPSGKGKEYVHVISFWP